MKFTQHIVWCWWYAILNLCQHEICLRNLAGCYEIHFPPPGPVFMVEKVDSGLWMDLILTRRNCSKIKGLSELLPSTTFREMLSIVLYLWDRTHYSNHQTRKSSAGSMSHVCFLAVWRMWSLISSGCKILQRISQAHFALSSGSANAILF